MESPESGRKPSLLSSLLSDGGNPGGSSTTDSRQELQSYLEFREVQLDQGR